MATVRLLAILAAGLIAARAGARADADPADQPPVPLIQDPPVYPFALLESGNRGSVVMEITVDTQGNVTRPAVLKSSHPDFEAPAVEAVLNWKYKPGTRNGQPVAMRIRVPIIINDVERGKRTLPHTKFHAFWEIPLNGSKDLPERFQYDRHPRPLLTGAPVYPFDLLMKDVPGKATVTFAIDPEGQPHVVKVENATLPEFGAAAAAMVATWRFKPATKDGKPCWALLSREQQFDKDDRNFPVNLSADRLIGEIRKSPCPILLNANDLDTPLQGRFQPGPIVPEAMMGSTRREEALLEFVVDHAGHAQLPRIVSATNEDFGWAAAAAVARWQYTQPTKNGSPVDVFVQVPVVFTPQKAPQTGS